MIFLLIWSVIACLVFTAGAMISLFGMPGIIPACIFAAFLLLPAVFFRNTIKNFLRDDVKESLHKKQGGLPKGWPYIAMAAGCVMLSLIALFVRPAEKISALVLCAADVVMFWLIFGILLLACSYFRAKNTASLEERYRNEMQSFLNVIRSQRHDLNFHVQTIAGLINEEKFEECRQYVNEVEEDISRMNSVLPISDPAICAMIHNFQVLSSKAKTVLYTDIQNDLSQIATNVYETNKIISNLLQNALDEVSSHKDKSYGIRLMIFKRGEYCVIRVSNEIEKEELSADELGHFYEQGYTTKTGHEGVGLSSIKTLADRYNGTVFTHTENNIIHFTAKIPINYAKEAAEA